MGRAHSALTWIKTIDREKMRRHGRHGPTNECRAVDVVQPNVGRVGGLTEAKRVAMRARDPRCRYGCAPAREVLDLAASFLLGARS
jgi:L-alanine-DL-glutamate epimerase-like enolase superfamily enzyme